MDQPALIVQLQRSHLAPEELFRFERSPVHIGRGPRNELCIDHVFVSHQHGVLHFDAAGVDYIDLGSTNGSFLEGVRLESHRFTDVHAGALLCLGTLRMRVKLDVRNGRPELAAAPFAHDDASFPSLDSVMHAAPLAAVIECFATSFLALSEAQRSWRKRIGLGARKGGLAALEDPVALVGYLLTPGREATRLEELEIACEELLGNERALVRAVAEEAALEEP